MPNDFFFQMFFLKLFMNFVRDVDLRSVVKVIVKTIDDINKCTPRAILLLLNVLKTIAC